MLSPDYALLTAIIIPLLGAFGIGLCGRWPNLREAITLLTATVLFLTVINIFVGFKQGVEYATVLFTILPGISITLSLEPLGMIFALIASFLWIATSIYSIGYMRGNKEHDQTRFYIFFAVAIAFTMSIAFAGNLFTLFIGYEMLTLSTYPLVAHAGTEKAKKGARTYMGILLSTSIGLLLVAILWTWNIAGTLDFRYGGILAGQASAAVIAALSFLYMYGIGKAALMPIHRWLPAAMVAPTPVSALLHAVAVVKAGVFSIVKILVYVFGVEYISMLKNINWFAGGWIVYAAGTTVILASYVALKQDNLKRRLAYSTISQLSYVIMAAAIFTKTSIIAAAFHIAAHAFGKITLFFAAGSIYTASKKTNVSQLSGIGKAMPWTMAAFTIGSLSMIAVPPTAGFISKWYMLSGAWETHSLFVVAVIILSTILNVMYFLPIVLSAFFGKSAEPLQHGEAPLPIVIALTITALGSVYLFLFPEPFLGLAHLLASRM